MKKVLSLFISVYLLFVFGCKSAPEPAPAPKVEPAPVVQPEPEPEPPKPVEPPAPKEDPMEFPKGIWVDHNWNAKWIISVSAAQIKDLTTDESIYLFTKANMTDEEKNLTEEGLVWSFVCKDTYRKYYLTKFDSKSKNKNLLLRIDRDWTDEPYSVELEKLD